ncbi:sporulation integral membrane protein YtvI [Geosporobacter ferrireducens]|uniref:Sporulation integral membrane protein YtvI n=1 Tax=Geosporobacter ferrireducens TaxID=1424294 RepID=A0A1D8GDW6_9FIRM|nr:sporulation integral membrane protein YtvI [Geosporobacter ferrireducens]AOT69107.1 sporulation integral membrane protein YtvI [Geosporobacter ferrireducens]MTI56782.1 sporulation integral membrane protein YtvI [Geosporobacter ferrireducens]
MYNDIRKYLPLFGRFAVIGLTILAIYFFATTLLFYILPFLLGWAIASMIEPLVDFLHTRLKLPRGLAALFSTGMFVLLVGSLIALIGGIIVVELTKLSIKLPEYSERLYFQSIEFVSRMQNLYFKLPPDIAQSIINGLNSLLNNLTLLIGKIISSLMSFLSGIPSFFVFLLVTMISTFFIVRDKKEITRFVVAQIPLRQRSTIKILKHDLLFALTGYIKAQLILMSFTFIESAVGLTLIGIDYSVLLALLASIIDALPILGSGSVYVPLIVWKALTGSYQTAIYLGILYGLIILIRQLLEPKVLGNQIGLYPLVTLLAMYIGLKAFGVIGLIIGPISAIVLITLQKVGILPRWKN